LEGRGKRCEWLYWAGNKKRDAPKRGKVNGMGIVGGCKNWGIGVRGLKRFKRSSIIDVRFWGAKSHKKRGVKRIRIIRLGERGTNTGRITWGCRQCVMGGWH